MATYQERLADARILCPAATSPDDPRVLAAAEQRQRIAGWNPADDDLWDTGLGHPSNFNYSGLHTAYRVPVYDRH